MTFNYDKLLYSTVPPRWRTIALGVLAVFASVALMLSLVRI